MTSSHYYACLWSHSLVRDLQWTNLGEAEQQRRQYIAPTWSWASTGNSDYYYDTWKYKDILEKFQREVHDIQCTLETADPCGKISLGPFVLRGAIFEGKVDYQSPQRKFDMHNGLVIHEDYRLPTPVEDDNGSMRPNVVFHFSPDKKRAGTAVQEPPVGTKIICLILNVQIHSVSPPEELRSRVSALILRHSPRREGCFERIDFGFRDIYDRFMLEKAARRAVRII
jgi:hypothetical protein